MDLHRLRWTLTGCALVACSAKSDDKPTASTPAAPTRALPRQACAPGAMPAGPIECRELPFRLRLDGYTRSDKGTVASFARTLPDGTARLVQIAPRIAPPSEEDLIAQIGIAAHQLEPQATQTQQQEHHLSFASPAGRRVEAVGELVGGYVVVRAAAGGSTGPVQDFLAPLERVAPDPRFADDGSGLQLPLRAWQYAVAPAPNTVIYALPDLHATLGVRRLDAGCDGLTTGDPAAYLATHDPLSLTVDTVAHIPSGIRVTTKDERPAVLALVCRKGRLVEVSLRGLALAPALSATLDQVIQAPGSAMRDDNSSSDRAQ